LRLSYQFGSESGVLNTIGRFQGRSVALDPSISIEGVKAVSAHIVTLEGKALDPSIFASGPELEEHSAALTKVGAGVMAGMIVKKVQPVYPESAKGNHTTGSVHLRAIIGTDGRIHSLKILDAPDPSLAISALAAVRQWTYKPYLLNGVPTEVDTMVTVNYAMNP
jgi:TonB family protein